MNPLAPGMIAALIVYVSGHVACEPVITSGLK